MKLSREKISDIIGQGILAIFLSPVLVIAIVMGVCISPYIALAWFAHRIYTRRQDRKESL